jgi:hypothetical protein
MTGKKVVVESRTSKGNVIGYASAAGGNAAAAQPNVTGQQSVSPVLAALQVDAACPLTTTTTTTMSSLSGLSLVAFFVTLSLVLAVSVPFTGTLVRFRASYNPRGLALDAEGGAQPHTGPVVNSYFGMMSRVYRIEVIDVDFTLSVRKLNHRYRDGPASTKEPVSDTDLQFVRKRIEPLSAQCLL